MNSAKMIIFRKICNKSRIEGWIISKKRKDNRHNKMSKVTPLIQYFRPRMKVGSLWKAYTWEVGDPIK